jgi:hypothetical protein
MREARTNHRASGSKSTGTARAGHVMSAAVGHDSAADDLMISYELVRVCVVTITLFRARSGASLLPHDGPRETNIMHGSPA